MANKYSKYELQPYVSQYVNPYSVEVSQILSDRWDKNKANIDLIDRTLGSIETMEGDRHHIENAKTGAKDKLRGWIEQGNLEDATLMVSEVMTDVESNRGVKLAQKSMQVRQTELDAINTATLNGIKMLDFGKGASSSHQSYYQDEDGNMVENVYKPTSQKEHDYDAEMAGLIKGIKADWSGISRSKADAISAEKVKTYLRGMVGQQDFDQLTKIQGMSPAEAMANITSRMQSFTDEYIHVSKAAADYNGGTSYSGIGAMNKGYVGIPTLTVADFKNKAMSMNKEVLNSGGDKKAYKDIQATLLSTANQLLQSGQMNQAEYDEYKQKTRDYWRGNDELGGLVNYMTTNTYQPTAVGTEEFSWGEVAATAGTVAAAGAPFAWLGPLEWAGVGVAATVAGIGNAGYQLLSKVFDNDGNVRDIMRPQGEGWDPNNPDKGWNTFLGIWDSEAKQLQDNLSDTETINELLGTNYKNGTKEYEQLKKNAAAMLRWKQHHGGDAVDDMIDSYQGDVFEAETYVPDLMNDEATRNISTAVKNFDPRDWDFLGIPEEGDKWEEMFKDKSGNPIKPGKATIQFQGILSPSIEDDTPLYVKWQINDDLYIAKSKVSPGGGYVLEERIAQSIDKTDFVVLDRARQTVNEMEERGQGEGVNGGVTMTQLEAVLEILFQNAGGLDSSTAEAYADGYISQSFEMKNPQIINAISAKYGVQDMQSVRETTDYKSLYNVYKQSEVRGY